MALLPATCTALYPDSKAQLCPGDRLPSPRSGCLQGLPGGPNTLYSPKLQPKQAVFMSSSILTQAPGTPLTLCLEKKANHCCRVGAPHS